MSLIIYSRIYSCRILCLALLLAMVSTACKKNADTSAPVITDVINYEAAPNDTSVKTVNAGQWVVVKGRNLGGVTQAYFGGVAATINNSLFSNETIVVQIPDIPFQSIPRDKLNEITVVSNNGTASFVINITGAPIIAYVRKGEPAPNDAIVQSLLPGMKVNIVGFNLKNATAIAFQGVAANLSEVVYTDTSAIVTVPSDLSGADATLVNTITYTTGIGTGSFSITIVGPPIITAVSNENPADGDSVYLYGNNFLAIQNLTFAGLPITSYKVSDDGSLLRFSVSGLSQSGPVKIETLAGVFTTAYNVNDIATGAISNFEWGGVFHWDWWGGASLVTALPEFPGNASQYLNLKSNVLDGGGGDEFSTAIRIGGVQWLPAANVVDPVSRWALKFEMSVPASWNGGSLCIKSSNGSYMVRYEPWRITAAVTAPYTTKGWQTVTIPLASFRKNDATLGDGRGAALTGISELLGAAGTSDLILYLHNYDTAPTATSFNAGFDNFRVVKR